jgi:hypothetical protein
MIVIGLGTGRCGTTSLAHLLGHQPNSVVFHEMSPSVMRFAGTPAPVINTVREFEAILDGGNTSLLTADLSRQSTDETYSKLCSMQQVSTLGDIAFYYLNYVETIIASSKQVRFVCLKRDRDSTINSWLKKARIRRWRSKWFADKLASFILRTPFLKSKNFWMEHDGTCWLSDPVWDKCFPKFEAPSMLEALALYYDSYYEKAELYAKEYADIFRIYSLEDLNSDEGKNSIMDFCGFAPESRNLEDVWTHRIKE